MKQARSLSLLLVLALATRLFFLYSQYSGDLKNHLVWGNGLLTSPSGFYSQHFAGFNDPNYPPLAVYLFALANLCLLGLNNLFSFTNSVLSFFPSFLVPLFRSENMAYAFLKLPGVMADLGIGYLLFHFASQKKAKQPLLLPALYLFNPAVIYLSSVWGQIEPVTNFFLLLSLFWVLKNLPKGLYLSLFFFSLATLTKQTALWFLPLYFFLWWKELHFKDWVKGVSLGMGVFFATYLPLGLTPLPAIKNYLSTLSGSSDVVSDAAWNLWSFIYPLGTKDSVILGIFSVRLVSIILILLILTVFVYRLKQSYARETFLKYLFLWSLIVFFLQTRVHERHLAPALIFFLLIPVPKIWLSYYTEYALLSAFHLYNLVYSLKLPFI